MQVLGHPGTRFKRLRQPELDQVTVPQCLEDDPSLPVWLTSPPSWLSTNAPITTLLIPASFDAFLPVSVQSLTIISMGSEVPACVHACPSLTSLNLQAHSSAHSISLPSLPHLQMLRLNHLPSSSSSLAALTNLTRLEWSVGKPLAIPVSAFSLSSVTSLVLDAINGPLPEKITKMPSLTSLSLRSSMSLTLPLWVPSMTRLRHLDLRGFRPSPALFCMSSLTSLSIGGILERVSDVSGLVGVEDLTIGILSQEGLESVCSLPSLRSLDVSAEKGTSIPEYFSNLTSLTELLIRGHLAHKGLACVVTCPSLEFLDVRLVCGTSLPLDIGKMLTLKKLIGTNTLPGGFSSLNPYIPESLTCLSGLEHLTCTTTTLPDNFSHLTALRTLELPRIEEISDDLCELRSLTRLTLAGRRLTLPSAFGNLTGLRELEVKGRELELPDTFGDLENLTHLTLGLRAQLGAPPTWPTLPDTLGRLCCLRYLELNSLSAPTLPASFGELHSLEGLRLTSCLLVSLPDSFGKLTSLTSLEMMHCNITAFPESFWDLSGLTYLHVEAPIAEVSERLGDLAELRSLTIESQALRRLPSTLRYLHNLKRLTLTPGIEFCVASAVCLPCIEEIKSLPRTVRIPY